MALGLFLIEGVFRVYDSNLAAYRWVNAHSKLQENFRFAVDTLADKVRASGYQGCSGEDGTVNVTLSNPSSYQNNFSVKLRGYRWDGTNWSPGAVAGSPALAALPASIASAADRKSDIITFRGGAAPAVPLNATSGASSVSVVRSGAQDDSLTKMKDILAAGGTPVAMVTDCEISTLVPVSSITGPSSNVYSVSFSQTLPGSSPFKIGSELSSVTTETYYVSALNSSDGKYWCSDPSGGADPDQCGSTGNCDTPALCRAQDTLPGRRIIGGVERLRISYGVDTDAGASRDYTPNRYVSADVLAGGAQWSQVVSVQLGLLLRTDKEIRQQQGFADFSLAGESINVARDSSDTSKAADKFMRRSINQVVAIRNRLK